MIKRFRLERKSQYEKLVIAQRLSDMLDKFLDGRRASLSIGAEKGGIDEWDDVVILHSADSLEYLQIKRQTTDFCTQNSDKTKQKVKVTKDGSAPNEPKASVIDKAFISLAKHAELGTFDSLPNRKFQLTLVSTNLQIKKGLRVDHLEELCELCRKDGLDLNDLASREDGPTKQNYLWLTTWCGFKDWEQIRDTLRLVTIACVGNDLALEQRAVESLGRHFSDPQRTLGRLITYITSETSDVSALDCHSVAQELKDELRADIGTWAQYHLGDESQLIGKSWTFAGTHDLGGVTPGTAQGVVEHMWSTELRSRKLRIYAPYTPPSGENLTLSSAILRMALHLPNGSQGLMLGESTWRDSVGYEVGHTLGCGESDLKNLPWLENPERLACTLDHKFETQVAIRKEAEALANAMDELVWQRLIESVTDKFTRITDIDLAEAMENVWLSWLADFNSNSKSRRKFLEQLLYPETEGKNPKHALRLGPRTLELLVTAVETLLLVAVGVAGNGTNWASFPDCRQVLSIAIKYWSGPVGHAPEVRELSDDHLTSVTGPSPAPIVILSGVSASPSELLNIGMADDAETATSMAAERQPYLLVTRSRVFQHLRRGTLASVQKHFIQQSQDRLRARQSAIETNAKGT
ncbi:ABC-three component system protein [Cobetia crustatorum]|uniref:ABC-three component system protein n=1 Tax=Cobetia crustatorum TaxID=553385 RepID=UPI00046A4DCD|nr:ABC-three component system protein [Cobetia crustatorum]